MTALVKVASEAKGRPQIAREVIAEAVKATADRRTESSSTQSEVQAGVACLEEGFKQSEPSLVLDIQMDARPATVATNGLVVANERASLYVPITYVGRAWRIDRSGLGKIEIVVPTKTDDAVQRLVAALGSVVADFDVWSYGVVRRNGRINA